MKLNFKFLLATFLILAAALFRHASATSPSVVFLEETVSREEYIERAFDGEPFKILESVISANGEKNLLEFKSLMAEAKPRLIKSTSKFIKKGHFLVFQIMMAMHFKWISDEQALNLYNKIAEHVESDYPIEFKFFTNMFGDNLIKMVKDASDPVHMGLNYEIYGQSWFTDMLTNTEGTYPENVNLKILHQLTKKCRTSKKSLSGTAITCSKNDFKFWKHFATLFMTSYILTKVGSDLTFRLKIFEKIYLQIDKEAVFYAGYMLENVGHAMLAHVFRKGDDKFLVRLYNTNESSYSPFKIEGGTQRDHTDAFYRPFEVREMTLEQLRASHFFYTWYTDWTDGSKHTMTLYPAKRVLKEDVPDNAWYYSRLQLSGTCVASSIWAWLRSLGPRGMHMEIYLKGAFLRILKSKYDAIQANLDILKNPSLLPIDDIESLQGEVYERFQKLKDDSKERSKLLRQYIFLDRLVELEKQEFSKLRIHPQIGPALISSGINEVSEHLLWILGRLGSSDKEDACSLYRYMIINLIAPFKNDKKVLENGVQPIIRVAEHCDIVRPPLTSNKTKKLVSKVTKGEQITKVLKTECPVGNTNTIDCYQAFYDQILTSSDFCDESENELRRVLEEWKTEGIPPEVAVIFKKTKDDNISFKNLNNIIVAILFFFQKKVDPLVKEFKGQVFKSQEDFEKAVDECNDRVKPFSFDEAENWAKCIKLRDDIQQGAENVKPFWDKWLAETDIYLSERQKAPTKKDHLDEMMDMTSSAFFSSEELRNAELDMS